VLCGDGAECVWFWDAALRVDLSNKLAAALVHQEGGGLLSAGRLCGQCSVFCGSCQCPAPPPYAHMVFCAPPYSFKCCQVLSTSVTLERQVSVFGNEICCDLA
jgi:hypothetical protein